MYVALWIVLALLALVAVSLVVEATRGKPIPPAGFAWAPEIAPLYAEIDGIRVRYLKTGAGPTLLLLHTLRTQLDIFQTVIPALAREFTVYAVDYPGHGWSDIPKTDYTPAFFTRFTTGFMDALELEDALVAGVSIGASIPLLMAAEGNPRIRAIVSINPYDYGQRGADRANAVAKLVFTLAAIPVVGETVMRLRNRLVEGKILEGGVATPAALPPAFREEVFRVGERPGHYQAFISLIRHMPQWRDAHGIYGRIRVPVLLVYGDRDWSREAERQTTLQGIPGAQLVMVPDGGHFLSLDQPEAVVRYIKTLARAVAPTDASSRPRAS
jgi:pimeloyl-ACP methyl ester carboxylesterase